MQIAEILSDLTSLRACDHTAAMNLVSARPSSSEPTAPSEATEEANDADLKRAKDLIDLHYAVKVAHQQGRLERDLDEAREGVRGALEGMGRG